MAVEQLPFEVRQFAAYLNGLVARLDQGGGWCGVFWQRDPDGMRACLDGWEVPPWDVVEALLQDLAAEYGSGVAAGEAERARALHGASLAAFDARPGGRDALGDRLDVLLREQRYAVERQAELGRLLGTASREAAASIRLDLDWARDDHERATARCAELRRRMRELDRRAGRARERPGVDLPADGGGAAPSPTGDPRGGAPASWSAFAVQQTPDHRDGPGTPSTPDPAAHADAAHLAEARAVSYAAHPDSADEGTYAAHPAPAGPGPDAYAANPVAAADPGVGTYAAHPTPADPGGKPAAPAVSGSKPRSKRRARGGARFAGMVEADDARVVAPAEPGPARRTPRGARFAGAAEEVARPQPRRQPLDDEGRRDTVDTVAALVRLRAEGRSGEAHALLVEAAYWPAARFPLLAAELHRAGLDADWATLLWEAASLPAGRLVAAADALVAAGRVADGRQMLRQGVARPAPEMGAAVLELAAAGRDRDVRALLDAYVRVRPPEEAARSAAADPPHLVPLLLESARGASEECYWDLVHALRVAGFAA
ncbi:hypothetical protein [Streptomyces sp. NPDC005907]|uniref:hypothetical protein n=1 Tax=Streptomyces sp. NPDC005907 TaxID=3154571 RepID=UPI0033CDD0AC